MSNILTSVHPEQETPALRSGSHTAGMRVGFVLILLFLIYPGWTTSVLALDCLEKSPAALQGKDPFGAIRIRDLTKVEYESVKVLLNSLVGKWQGRATETYCNLKNADDQTVHLYDLTAKVKMDHAGDFFMKIELYQPQERTSHQKTFRFYLNDMRLRVNHDNRTGDVEIIAFGGDKIDIFRRFLHRIPNNTVVLHKSHYIYLKATDAVFSIRQLIYTQGLLSENYVWRLHRK